MFFTSRNKHFLGFFALFGLWSSWHNSKIKLLLKIFSVALITLLFIVFSLTVLIDRFRDFTALSNIVFNVLVVFLFVTHLVILLESILKHEAQGKLIKTFSEVDRLFYAEIGTAIPYRSEKYAIFLRLLILTLIEVIVKATIVITLLFSSSDKKFAFFALYSNFIICLRLVQIICFMYLLQKRVELVNTELMDIHNLISYKNQIQQTANHETNNKPIRYLRNSMYTRLLSLKRIYGNLFEICEQINETFGWSLLTMVIFIFATVTFELYWAYVSLNDAATALVCLFFSVPICITLGTLAYICSSCCQLVRMMFEKNCEFE